MRKRIVAAILSAMFLAVSAAPAFADQPPGQKGYEGQPGNQGGGGGSHGLQGYEGQPGNQGGH